MWTSSFTGDTEKTELTERKVSRKKGHLLQNNVGGTRHVLFREAKAWREIWVHD